MARIKISLNEIGQINYFENYTKLKTKDCFLDEVQNKLVFVVIQGEIKKLLGNKRGVDTIRKLEKKFNKKLRIIEYNPDPKLFIKNAILPLKVDEIVFDDETRIYTLKSTNHEVKSMIIGKNAINLNNLKKIVHRYFSDFEDIRVE